MQRVDNLKQIGEFNQRENTNEEGVIIMMKVNIKKQTLVEYVLILAAMALIFSGIGNEMAKSTKHQYYASMSPLTDEQGLPEPPEGMNQSGGEAKNKLPVAKIQGPTEVVRGEEYKLHDVSYDEDGTIVSTSWGVRQKTFAGHNEVGEYTHELTVTDNRGGVSTTTHTVKVVDIIKEFPIEAQPAVATVDEEIYIRVFGMDNAIPIITHAEWTFKDSKGKVYNDVPLTLSGGKLLPGALPPETYTITFVAVNEYGVKSKKTTATFEIR